MQRFFSEWFWDLPAEERPVLAGSVRERVAMGRLRQEEEERGRGNPRMRKKRKKKREGGGGANTKGTEAGGVSGMRDVSKIRAEAKKIAPKEKGLIIEPSSKAGSNFFAETLSGKGHHTRKGHSIYRDEEAMRKKTLLYRIRRWKR